MEEPVTPHLRFVLRDIIEKQLKDTMKDWLWQNVVVSVEGDLDGQVLDFEETIRHIRDEQEKGVSINTKFDIKIEENGVRFTLKMERL